MAHVGDEAARVGHRPFVFYAMHLDRCARKYNTYLLNLLPQSEQFNDAGWTKNDTEIDNNEVVAPDNTLTGDVLRCSTATDPYLQRAVSITTTDDPIIGSIYIKQGTADRVRLHLLFTGGTSNSPYIDYTFGDHAVVEGNSATGLVEYLSNGWYRIGVYYQDAGANTTVTLRLALYDTSGHTIGDTVSIWGAQIERRWYDGDAQTYNSNFAGYVKTKDVAKEGSCRPKSENLLLYSEDISQSDWSKTNVTVTTNDTDFIDNTSVMDRVERTASGAYSLTQDYTTTSHANKTYTFSLWLQKGNYTETVTIAIRDGSGTLINSETSPSLVDGLMLFTCTATFGGSPAANVRVEIAPDTSPGSAGDYIRVGGLSLCEGSVAKCYVRTTTEAIESNAGGLDNALKCYETYETCQVTSDYGVVSREYRFCDKTSETPVYKGVGHGVRMIPLVASRPSFTSTKIIPGKGYSARGAISVTFQDAVHHDRGFDPYWSDRTHDTSQGTLFGKLISRNRHYHSRPFIAYSGYLVDSGFSLDTFDKRSYVLDSVTGPNINGRVTITAKDVLALADDKVKVPAATDGKLTAAVTAAATSFSIAKESGYQYDRSGYVKVGSEIIQYDYIGHNYLTKSEEFDHSDWTKTGLASVASASVTDPFGGSTCYLVTENSSSGTHLLYQAASGAVSGDAYTFHVYAKAHASGSGYIQLATQDGTAIAIADLNNGHLVTDETGEDWLNAVLESAGNDWYRISITNSTVGNTNEQIIIQCLNTSLAASYTGTGNAQFYIWAAGVNSGSKIGNYYKTTTSQYITDDQFIVASGGRSAFNSATEAHSQDDVAQQCLVYNGDNIVDVINDLLVNKSGVCASCIPYNNDSANPDEWDNEKENWLSSFTVLGVIVEPTEVSKLLQELLESSMVNIWVDEVEGLVKLKAEVPPELNATVTAINDQQNHLKDSLTIKRAEGERLSQVWVIFAKINQAEGDDSDNYESIYAQADPASEESISYGVRHVKKIRSRWLSSSNTGQAGQLAGRTLARFTDAPKIAEFKLHAKDYGIKVGDLVDITTSGLQNYYGASDTVRFQILERREVEPAEIYSFVAMESSFVGVYGFIGPNTLLDYSAESDVNKQKYAFICYNTEYFNDGQRAYKII